MSKRSKSKGLLSEDFLAGNESQIFDHGLDVDEQLEAIDTESSRAVKTRSRSRRRSGKKELAMALNRGALIASELDSDEDDENDLDEAYMTNAQKLAHRAEKRHV